MPVHMVCTFHDDAKHISRPTSHSHGILLPKESSGYFEIRMPNIPGQLLAASGQNCGQLKDTGMQLTSKQQENTMTLI